MFYQTEQLLFVTAPMIRRNTKDTIEIYRVTVDAYPRDLSREYCTMLLNDDGSWVPKADIEESTAYRSEFPTRRAAEAALLSQFRRLDFKAKQE